MTSLMHEKLHSKTQKGYGGSIFRWAFVILILKYKHKIDNIDPLWVCVCVCVFYYQFKMAVS